MKEIELKLQVPARQRAALATALAGRGAGVTTLRLQAAYLDTPDRALARAGVALRLRREGRVWVQTLKAAGSDAMQRLEHNVPRPGRGAVPPPVEPQLHAGTPAGERLQAALRAAADPTLACIYRTDIRRQRRRLRSTHGTLELAFDQGLILAGERRLPVCELEIELLGGAPQAVLDTARRWGARHGLWLDVRSKAERGDLLARGETLAPAVMSAPPVLDTTMDLAQGRRAVLACCADQVLGNAGVVAGGDHRDEHLHQLRVGLRRLRSALRLFDGAAAAAGPLGQGAATLFRRLGAARDRAAVALPLQATLQQALAGAGLEWPAPELPQPATAEAEPPACLREPASQGLLLDLLAALQPGPDEGAAVDPPTPLRETLARRLNRWHRQVAAELPGFATLDDAGRHRLRKRVKRLRYAVEFAAPLFEARRVKRYLKPLRALQDRLGVLNDVVVGLAGFRAAAAGDTAAAFAVGWLAARRERLLADCAPALKDVARARRFWK